MEKDIQIRRISFADAKEYIRSHGWYHIPGIAPRFCLGLYRYGELSSVAMCGRPEQAGFDWNGRICQIAQLCIEAKPRERTNLYLKCCDLAKSMGYKRAITTAPSSMPECILINAGFICDGAVNGYEFRRKESHNAWHFDSAIAVEMKWHKKLKG